MKDDDIKGLSFYCCVGKWGGIRFERAQGMFWRVCLGWFAFGCMSYDIEQFLSLGSDALKKIKEAGL